MSNKYAYALEKLYTATLTMARSPLRLADRLADAYLDSVMHVNPDEMPQDIRERLHALRAALTAKSGDGDEGDVRATTRQMDDHEARKLIELVVDLFNDVERLDALERPR